jgi:hypothetical protein
VNAVRLVRFTIPWPTNGFSDLQRHY